VGLDAPIDEYRSAYCMSGNTGAIRRGAGGGGGAPTLCVRSWRRMFDASIVAYVHPGTSHWKGLSLPCRSVCFARSSLRLDAYEQYGHLNGFSPAKGAKQARRRADQMGAAAMSTDTQGTRKMPRSRLAQRRSQQGDSVAAQPGISGSPRAGRHSNTL
jgi:hypothetical protein